MNIKNRTCPTCGGSKSFYSKECVKCDHIPLRKAKNIPLPCPVCGGTKSLEAKKCIKCAHIPLRKQARSEKIFILRMKKKLTYQQIAILFGITRSRVQQIVQRQQREMERIGK